jgi:hypothetical protein
MPLEREPVSDNEDRPSKKGNRAVNTPAASKDSLASQFVHALYRVLLLREPDVGGFERDVQRIESGLSPEDLMGQFFKSKEFSIKYTRFIDTYDPTASPKPTALQAVMTKKERDLLTSFLRCSKRYLEFGSGGSTVLAATHVGESAMSVDSSKVWQAKVTQSCATAGTRIVPVMVHVDIGPIRDWGHPVDDRSKDRWPEYASAVWARPQAWTCDLCLIDGRFRVASFISALLHCSPLTTVMIHDFPERPQYHVVRQFADMIATADTLAVFRRRLDFNAERALSVLEEAKFQPA